MTITTSSLVRDGAEAVDFVSDRIQAPEGALATDRAGLAEVRPRFKICASRPRRTSGRS